MAILNCKMCGGELNITAGVSVCECEYCGSRQTVPSINDEKKTKLYERANKLRSSCEFDRAYSVYESIIDEFGDEAEAYWGLILCKYGIEYVDDPKTGKKIPTCHRSSYECVLDDEAFEMVMESASSEARAVYREQAIEIEEIRKGIIELSSKEEPYDIFICYKESDEKGERTIDSVLAQDIYTALTKEGYRVFFAKITLESKIGSEYEPLIFSALHSARVMLAIGTSYDYYHAVWVRNEWSRYLKMIAAGEKKTLVPCYKDISPYDLPKEFKHLQAQDLGRVGAIQDLLRGIEKLIPKNKVQEVVVKGEADKIENLLKRANMSLGDGDFKKAEELFDKILDVNVGCGEAYLGLDLVKHQAKDHIELAKKYAKTEEPLSSNLKEAKKLLANEAWILEFDRAYEKALKEKREMERAAKEKERIAKEKERIAKEKEAFKRIADVDGTTFKKYKGNGATFVIPNYITEIGANAFEDCTSLKGITIPDSVTSIGVWAFKGCTSLNGITIPDSVTRIGNWAFYGCTSLTSVNISDIASWCTISFGNHSANPLSYAKNLYVNGELVKEIVIPNSVTSIGGYAFCDCTSLEGITIPDSVTSIGGAAFCRCTSLKGITIPDSVTSIGYNAFEGCKFANERQAKKVCVYCGGEFKGLFSKTCTQCGRKKSY